MGVKQPKSQEEMAFMSAGEVKPELVLEEGTETPTVGSKAESQAEKTLLFNRTALYGSVCRVVWEGGAARLLPIPIPSVRAGPVPNPDSRGPKGRHGWRTFGAHRLMGFLPRPYGRGY